MLRLSGKSVHCSDHRRARVASTPRRLDAAERGSQVVCSPSARYRSPYQRLCLAREHLNPRQDAVLRRVVLESAGGGAGSERERVRRLAAGDSTTYRTRFAGDLQHSGDWLVVSLDQMTDLRRNALGDQHHGDIVPVRQGPKFVLNLRQAGRGLFRHDQEVGVLLDVLVSDTA
jgi:hypothetical protein